MANRHVPDSPRVPDPNHSAKSEKTAPSGESRKRAPRGKKSLEATARTESSRVEISEEVRRGMIAEGAYLRAERRGFEAGHEVEDWLAAEAEVDALLRAAHGGKPQ